MPNKHLMNCCHLNDSTLVHETEFNKLKTQNMHEKYLERPTAREKLEIVKKKTTEQKYTGNISLLNKFNLYNYRYLSSVTSTSH